MHQDDPGLEQRLSRFEAQLDRFSLALHQWRETQGQASPADELDLDIGAAHPAPGPSAAATWPLERVVHLHDELRRTSNGESAPNDPALPDVTPGHRVRLLPAGDEGTVLPGATASRRPTPRWWFVSGALVAAAVILLTIVAVGRIEARLNEASARVAVAEQQVVETTQLANREVAAARQDADRQIAEARQLAQRAETVGVILTAPDLIRFNLTSAETVGPSAQLLWSRTRGLVLSGSRLPAAPPESTYQLWLVTNTQSVGAGLFVPDDAGRATLVVDAPPRVQGAVVGAAVTIEPSGGRPTPSGRTLLARFP